jgi:hypothetical protein
VLVFSAEPTRDIDALRKGNGAGKRLQ